MSTSNNKIFCDFPCDCKDLAKLISPTPQPSQTPTETPAPGVSTTPTNTPQVSLTPTQTSSPGASPTPTPTNTPEVSSTPPSTQIPGVSATPTPSVTPPPLLDIIIKTLTLNYRPNRLASSAVPQTIKTNFQYDSKRLIVSSMSSNILTFVNQEIDEIDGVFPYIATNSGPVMDVVANYEDLYNYVTNYRVLNSNINSVGILGGENSGQYFTPGGILNSSFGQDVYKIMAVEGLVFVVGSGGLYEKSRIIGLASNQILGINVNSRVLEVNTFKSNNSGIIYGAFYITTTAGAYYISWSMNYPDRENYMNRSLLYPATNNADFRGIDLGDSQNLYMADYANNVVNVYALNSLIHSISVGRGPTEVKYNPILNHVYVCNYNDNTVSVINAATKAVVKTIPVGAGPDALQISVDGTKLYVANSLTNTITIISQLDKLKQDIFIPVAISPTPSSSPTRTPAPSLSLTPTPTSTPVVANVFVASVSNGTRSTSSLASINPVVNFTINDNQTYLTDNIQLELYSYNIETGIRTPMLYNGSTSTTFARTIYDPNNVGQPNGSSFSFDIPINSLPPPPFTALYNTEGPTLVYSIRLRVRKGNYIGPWSNYVEFAVYTKPIYYA